MSLTYVLLSSTFGMHQYTADLANRIADCELPIADWEGQMADGKRQIVNRKSSIGNPPVALVTTTTLPRDRYSPNVRIETPVTMHGTGFSAEGLDPRGCRRVLATIEGLGTLERSNVQTFKRSVVHFTGVHAWNVPLVYALRRRGVAVIHTLHDLHPHGGVRHGRLIGLWNRLIIGSGAHILVHGRRYRAELIARGVAPERITYAPLLHGFWGHAGGQESRGTGNRQSSIVNRQSSIENPPTVLFFGRVEPYKGVDVLLAAWEGVQREAPGARLVIAGPAAGGVMTRTTPNGGIEWRDRLIEDDEAIDLFRSASLLVLPYRDATQSALIAAAYTFGLPVIVTATGALPEYVMPGETGWVVTPGDPAALAAALKPALADADRLQAMGQAGRAWYERQRGEEEAALSAMYVEAARGAT